LVKREKAAEMENKEMTVEEAKAFRASLYKAAPKKLNDREKRESFRIFWVQNRKKYAKSKNLESIIWLHLKSVKMDEPEKFEAGLSHFGLKKIK
jgi:hypothetical protein